jgi:hypothetical protein
MLNAIHVESSGVENGKVILDLLGDDQRRYEMTLTRQAASEILLALLVASKSLPLTNDGAVVPEMICSLRFAVGHERMNPAFVLGVGGLDLAIPLTETQLTSLRDDMSAHLLRMSRAQ